MHFGRESCSDGLAEALKNKYAIEYSYVRLYSSQQ